MRPLTADPIGLWTHRIGLVFFGVLVCAVIAPGGAFWTAVLGTGVAGSIAATALVVRSRRVPSLAQVKVGDRILFGKYSGTEIERDGEEVLVVREDEVLAIVG